MRIDGTPIGVEEGVYYIAEAGVNHNGDIEIAKKLIDAAADAGADAVKLQTFSADDLVVESAPKAEYQKQHTDESQYEMLQKYELDRAEHEELLDHAEECSVTLLSTPCDGESVRLLDELDRPAIKIGSGDLNNHPMLEQIAVAGRPMIVSTGMSTMPEVERAVEVIREANPDVPLALLHCTSEYPTAVEDVNLRAMERMAEQFSVPVGHSDHTTAVETPAMAVAAGACIVEKHFTLGRRLPGPDHEASLEPDELRESVRFARASALARGSSVKRPTAGEWTTRTRVRKSLHTSRELSPGESLSRADLTVVRPADGLPPGALDRVVGRTVTERVEREAPVTADVVEGDIDLSGLPSLDVDRREQTDE
ncbi:N-acetylneuraminate synthase [Halobaculum sp. MBLA0147]|uniref:N-acetylneuraminate synthase n=1 Tax=Halobaculum sp. MBLA0147 TaxID=3079934 RepID=UPI00352413F7